VKNSFACAALMLAATWSAAADDDAAKAAKKIEGTYEVQSATRGGKPDPKGDGVKAFVIKDGKITIQIKDADKEMVATFKLDPSKKPAEIDLVPEDAGGNVTIKGIYQTKDTDKGLELTIAFPHGESDTRPKDFKGAGDDEIVVKLLRKK
jgi:uncharacterized protein (TIGR03067 family)